MQQNDKAIEKIKLRTHDFISCEKYKSQSNKIHNQIVQRIGAQCLVNALKAFVFREQCAKVKADCKISLTEKQVEKLAFVERNICGF